MCGGGFSGGEGAGGGRLPLAVAGLRPERGSSMGLGDLGAASRCSTMRRRGRCVRPARSRVPATAIMRLVAKVAPVAGALLVFAPVASAQVHAAVSVQTGGGTRIVV